MKKCKILSVTKKGFEKTFNVTMKSEQHNYAIVDNKYKIFTGNSHSDAYAYEAIKCGYLKAHYPLEFFVASLLVANSQRQFDIVDKYEKDAARFGFKILNTDINKSKVNYSICGDKEIIRPLMIKEIGPKVAEVIERNQPYNGPNQLLNFALKVGDEVGVSAIENYYDAGVFDHIKMKKQKLLDFFESVKKDKKRSKNRPIGDIFS